MKPVAIARHFRSEGPGYLAIYLEHLGVSASCRDAAELAQSWCFSGAREVASHPGPGVQSAEAMQRDRAARLATLHAAADRIYGCRMQGL
jgi:hypothetical protein